MKMKLKAGKSKSQMEIMGLAIIVILAALAMIFVIQFIVVKQPTDIKKAFTHKELAANTVNTLLSTTTDCKELSIAQLLEDCAEGALVSCPGGDSCAYAEQVIDGILEETLVEWNKEFYYHACGGWVNYLIATHIMNRERRNKSKSQPYSFHIATARSYH